MKKLKNIIIVCDYACIEGGATKVAVESAIALSKEYNVVFFAGSGNPCTELSENNINVISLMMTDLLNNKSKLSALVNGVWNRQSAKKFKMLLQSFEQEETIIHFHSWTKVLSSSVFRIANNLGFKTVLTLHDYFSVCPNGGLYNYKADTICKNKPMSLKCVICNCDKRNYMQKIWRVTRQILISKYVLKNKRLTKIYISNFSYEKLKKYIKDEKKINILRNPYELGEEIIHNAEEAQSYLYVGRVSPEKGVDIYCMAFSRLISEGKFSGKAIVVGDGELYESLKKEFPEIDFKGWKTKSEIEKIVKSTRALIFPSKWYETAGLTPIEFMAHGVPCIIADNCAAVEYINNGENGLLFKSADVEDLMKKIEYAEDTIKWASISRNLRESFDRYNYSREKYIKELVNIYKIIQENCNEFKEEI